MKVEQISLDPYVFKLTSVPLFDEALDWCRANIAPYAYSGQWGDGRYLVLIKREADAALFKVRFS